MTQTSLFEAPSIRFDPVDTSLFVLQRSRLGAQRKLDLKKVANAPAELKQELVNATAKIMESKELTAIYKLDGTFDRWLSRRVLPSVFRNGIYVVSQVAIKAVDTEALDYRDQREQLVPTFVARYQDIVSANRAKLGPVLSGAIRWPGVTEVTEMFYVRWRWMKLEMPVGTLARVDPDIALREEAKFAESMREQEQLVISALSGGLKRIVDRMVERLTPGPDGKKKVFRDTLVANFREFLETFPARYIVENQELESLVNKANQLMAGVAPEDLRDQSVAASMLRGMEAIKEELDPIVAGTRAITFEDDTTDEPESVAS
jgi:hypothetical protein